MIPRDLEMWWEGQGIHVQKPVAALCWKGHDSVAIAGTHCRCGVAKLELLDFLHCQPLVKCLENPRKSKSLVIPETVVNDLNSFYLSSPIFPKQQRRSQDGQQCHCSKSNGGYKELREIQRCSGHRGKFHKHKLNKQQSVYSLVPLTCALHRSSGARPAHIMHKGGRAGDRSKSVRRNIDPNFGCTLRVQFDSSRNIVIWRVQLFVRIRAGMDIESLDVTWSEFQCDIERPEEDKSRNFAVEAMNESVVWFQNFWLQFNNCLGW